MAAKESLIERASGSCELCGKTESLDAYTVGPKPGDYIEEQVLICGICQHEIKEAESLDVSHWRCLNDSMWNAEPAIQVLSYRMLKRLNSEAWARDLLDMMYMEEETKTWADSEVFDEVKIVHKDSNGEILSTGDSVVLIKDLNVKGGGFTAKRGTPVRRITLDRENENFIEGKINGQQIVILTEYVKKS